LCFKRVNNTYWPKLSFTWWDNKCNKKKCLTRGQKRFIATIAGESIGQGEIAWRAVAHVIKNRMDDKKHEFKKLNTVHAVVAQKGAFDAYGSSQYKKCMKYLKNRTRKDKDYEKLIGTVMPIFRRKLTKSDDITKGALLFYSPRSMKKGTVPPWSIKPSVKEINVKGIKTNDFRFFKYK
jgi:hypothetical protein